MRALKLFIIAIILIFSYIKAQQLEYNGFIQTRKLFLFGPDNGFEYSQFGTTHNFLFEREFQNVPRVGLSVYTIDFEHSPDFSCRITSDTNKTATGVRVTSFSTNNNNRIYIMYIATDNQQVGIFVPDRLYTDQLSLPTRTKYFQNFDFNFKEEISQFATQASDISLTVYLTGASMISQMTTNGFPTNRTSLNLKVSSSSTRFYSVEVIISQEHPYMLVDWVQCTVLYFIPSVLLNNRYQANSGIVSVKNFGGTRQTTTQSVSLLPLASNNKFQNLKFFFGISKIDCKDGTSITLLGVEKYYTSQQDSQIRLLLQIQAWKLTFIQVASYNYIQYKSLKCTQPEANCPSVCSDGTRPYFMIQDKCYYCHYSCLTCNVTNSQSYCDTCHSTRTKNPTTNLCDCKNGYYETYTDYQCESCFPCATCDRNNTCLTCLDSQNMILNPVTSQCECKAGYYPNKINGTYVKDEPCLKCGENCLYCVNGNICKACSIETYLLDNKCVPICSSDQRFVMNGNKYECVPFVSNTYDQEGRLSFDWTYRFQENQLIIDLVFSQPDMAYYYYEGGKGYTYQDYKNQMVQGGNPGSGSGTSVYYDDGIYSNGYGVESSNNSTGGNSGASPYDQSALRGQYYGYGQSQFFKLLYENDPSQYKDQYGIPYGKYRVSTSPQIVNPNYVDALSRNLVFHLSNQTIPYTMQGVSNNRFILRARPSRTYINALGVIQIKNPALVRSNNTALQIVRVPKQIGRYDYYTAQQISTANSIRESNEILVDILWGISKYPLFVGFGWPFLPLMLAMQYIMSFNYIDTILPLNLDYFLSSFRDFRNPSIFYNPFRDQFDAKILSHPNIYKSYPQFQEFDRGIDFMKNSFQFFFIPFLAVVFLCHLNLLNLIFKKCCRRDFTIISKFLVPRLPLLIAAYTLVQALPVSFFFFAQLKDTTFRHSDQPSAAYPTFNTAMAFLAFFLTCAIPILLLAGLYYHFNYGNRISKFSDANVFNKKFLNRIQNSEGKLSKAHLHDPLWGGNHTKYGTYILGISIFALPIIFGFFIAFFIYSFAWQLAGIILFTVVFLAFVIAANFFKDKVFKVFFIIFALLMLAYLLLHAGIGSNRAIGTYDQWNTGYLGIGILYALLITAILFTAYLLYKFFRQAYQNHKTYGTWVDIDKQNEVPAEGKQVQRVQQYRRDTKLKSTFLKNSTSNLNPGAGGTNVMGLGSSYNYNLLTSNVRPVPIQQQDNLYSQQRMIIPNYNTYESNNLLQQLVLNKHDSYNKEISFVSKNTNVIYGFSQENGKMLLSRQPLYIDRENKIYDKNRQFIDYYFNLVKRNQVQAVRDTYKDSKQAQSSYQTITSKKQIYVINNQQFERVGEESDGNVHLRNTQTGQVKAFNLANFKKTSESMLRYNSSSTIQIPYPQNRQSLQKYSSQTHHIIYNGEEYLDMGYDPTTRQFKLLNLKTNNMERMSKNRYMSIIQESFKKRIIINNQEHDYEGTSYGKVYLINNRTGEKVTMSQNQFKTYRQENLKKFRENLDKNMSGGQEKHTILYHGQEYQELGVDNQGRHRLYNPQTRKHILLQDSQYRSIYGSIGGNNLKGSQNLLLLQSAVGTMKRAPSQKQKQMQMKLNSQTSRYFIFDGEKGSKIYIPKSKIDTDQPIEVDQNDNIRQNGKIIVTRDQSRQGYQKSSRKIQTRIQQHVVTRKTIQLPSRQYIERTQQFNIEKQEVSAGDVINPDRYYKIIGIPSQKVVNFEYKPKDVFITERNIRGREVMQRVQRIQQKYPTISILVKGESDESQEYWLS